MKVRRLGIAPAVSLALLAGATAPAPAATLEVSGGTLVYTAEAGEDNAVAFVGEDTVTVYDLSGHIALPGVGCLPSPSPDPYSIPPGVYVDYTCTGVTEGVEAVTDDGFDLAIFETEALPITADMGPDEDSAAVLSSGPAVLLGGDDDDFLGSGSGADTLDGGAGEDFLSAGSGSDTLLGGAGGDYLEGDTPPEEEFPEGDFTPLQQQLDAASRDHDTGPPGDDVLDGGDGDDRLYGGGGADRFTGGARRDPARLEGDGADTFAGDIEGVQGTDAADELTGSAGDDEILGAGGDDRIAGLGGIDTLKGEAGNDTIDAGAGADSIDGGGGDDIVLARDGEADRVACGDGFDRAIADANDLVESTCETVERPGGPAGGGTGTLTATAKAVRSGRKQTITVSGKLAGAPCQGLVRVIVKGLSPRGASTLVKPDCTFSVKLVGNAKRKRKLPVSVSLGALKAKAFGVRTK